MPPIFIHSLFRSGSTYLFNVFRRSDQGYWCYQEPLNEFLDHLNSDPEQLISMAGQRAKDLRHPSDMDTPYFWEFYQIREKLKGLFDKSFCYRDFFIDKQELPEAQEMYFNALMSNARGRPVLQLCRGTGRARALRKRYGGTHIHLWREPKNQWWSFKVNNYFDAAMQLIYNARGLPQVLEAIKHSCKIISLNLDNIDHDFEIAYKNPLNSRNGFQAFFAFWLYSWMEHRKISDMDISIDRLGIDPSYRQEVYRLLTGLNISGIDFSDCSSPAAMFSAQESRHYADLQDRVRAIFIENGYGEGLISEAFKACNLAENITAQADPLRDEARARQIALACIDARSIAHRHALEAEKAARIAHEKTVQADQNAAREAEQAAGFRDQAARAAQQAEMNRIRARELHSQLEALYQSYSWKITLPLRKAASFLAPAAGLIRRALKPVGLILEFLLTRSAIKPLVNRFPNLEKLIPRSQDNTDSKSQGLDSESSTAPDLTWHYPDPMTENAQKIYRRLKNETSRRNLR